MKTRCINPYKRSQFYNSQVKQSLSDQIRQVEKKLQEIHLIYAEHYFGRSLTQKEKQNVLEGVRKYILRKN